MESKGVIGTWAVYGRVCEGSYVIRCMGFYGVFIRYRRDASSRQLESVPLYRAGLGMARFTPCFSLATCEHSQSCSYTVQVYVLYPHGS